jgi:hypothetical protein
MTPTKAWSQTPKAVAIYRLSEFSLQIFCFRNFWVPSGAAQAWRYVLQVSEL